MGTCRLWREDGQADAADAAGLPVLAP